MAGVVVGRHGVAGLCAVAAHFGLVVVVAGAQKDQWEMTGWGCCTVYRALPAHSVLMPEKECEHLKERGQVVHEYAHQGRLDRHGHSSVGWVRQQQGPSLLTRER